MSAIIDAGSAKLAGLQIDTLSKFRAGQITLDQWERFNNLSPDDRESRFGDWKRTEPATSTDRPVQVEKFALLVDLGIITVPDDYDHATWLKTFSKKNCKKFYYYNDNITDDNFSNPSRVLKPGDKFRVRAFRQVMPGTTTSEERLAFLATQKAIYTGAQGAALVFDQKRDQLPKDKWYASFDEKKRLWKDAYGSRRVPFVLAYSGGGFGFDLGFFEGAWRDSNALLSFGDLDESSET